MAFYGPKEFADYPDCERSDTAFSLNHSFDGGAHCKIFIYKDLDWACTYLNAHFEENSAHIDIVHRINTMQIVASLLEDDIKSHLFMVMITVDVMYRTFKCIALLRDPWSDDDGARIVLNYIDNRWFSMYKTSDKKILPERNYKSLGDLLDAVRIVT